MRTTTMQSNLTVGELSPAMLARVDHEIYYSGVAKAQNVVIMPHGGLRRRPGLTAAHDSLLAGSGKLFSFEFSTEQDYVIHLSPNKVEVFKNGAKTATVTTAVPYATVEQCKAVDVAQAGDIMVLTHPDHAPQGLIRMGSHTSWKMEPIPLTGIPTYRFQGEAADEPVWSATRGWPAVCTFYQNRLIFAGSPQRPNSVWGSKINSFFDFDIGTGQADFGFFDTLDSDRFNRITNVYAGRNLMVFTTGSEYYNVAEILTPETSAWKRSTSFGSKRVRPLMVDGAVLFVDGIGRTVRSAVYKFQEDAFVAPSISVPSEHLITQVVSMDAVKGTNIDISDFVYVINKDGTMAVLNTLRAQGTEGWTQWTTQGRFIDVVVVNEIVYFMVERGGEYHLEYINEGTTTDHNTFKTSATPFTTLTTSQTPAMAALIYKVILDKSMQADHVGGNFTFDRSTKDAEVGLDVDLVVVTMPLNSNTQSGVSRNSRKRVIKVMLNMLDSLGVYANTTYAPDRQFMVILDKMPVPYTGLKEIFLLGYSRETQIKIHQNNPLPFKLLGISWEVETGDL